jgi:hypothetical protein
MNPILGPLHSTGGDFLSNDHSRRELLLRPKDRQAGSTGITINANAQTVGVGADA